MRHASKIGALLAALCATQAVLAGDLVIVGATVRPAPGEAPITNAAVVVREDRIISVGPAKDVEVGADATVIDASGATLMAGFWNSHVHFLGSAWAGAARQPASRLEMHLQDMLVRYGFTTVVDTGSDARDILALRARIESGDVAGPRILTAMSPLFPPDGLPYYIADLPPDLLARMPQPATVDEATAAVRSNLEAGGDVVKLFTASWAAPGRRPAKPMPALVARAAVEEAHRRGVLAFAHPSDVGGLEIALDAGVDVLAHAVEDLEGFEPSHLQRMRERGMVLVPTLKLFSVNPEPTVEAILHEVGDYQRMGGIIWFGTDVGFMEDSDPALEFELLQRAGLSADQILAALTTAPANRLPGGGNRGRVAAGMIADLVVLDGDPAQDPRAWTRLRYVFRDGRKLFDSAAREDR